MIILLFVKIYLNSLICLNTIYSKALRGRKSIKINKIIYLNINFELLSEINSIILTEMWKWAGWPCRSGENGWMPPGGTTGICPR